MSFRGMKFELQSYVPELNPLQCGVRLNRAYQTLLDMHQWSFLNREALITTVGEYTTGTVTAAAGSTTVTGALTAWTAGMANRFIRLGTQPEFYKISTVNVALQTLTVESAIGTAATASGYSIFQYHYAKPTSCKHIVAIRRQLELTEKTQEWLDGFDPDRDSTGEPIYWCNFDEDTIELYPPADQVYTVRVTYKIELADMSAEMDVPLLPEHLVISYAVLMAYRQLGNRAETAHYLRLIGDARQDFQQAWTAAFETDLSKQTLPDQVRRGGVDLPTSSDFWIRHDDFWSGF